MTTMLQRVAVLLAVASLARAAQTCTLANSQQTCTYTFNDGATHNVFVPANSAVSAVVVGGNGGPFFGRNPATGGGVSSALAISGPR